MLLLYDKDGAKIDLEQQLTYCGNPAYLSEPCCIAWGLWKVYNMLPVLQEEMELEYDKVFTALSQQLEQQSSTSPHSNLQTSTLPTALPATLPTSSLISPTPFNPHSAPSTKKEQRVFSATKSDREVEIA